MRPEQLELLVDTLEYNRARYRLTRTLNAETRKVYEEIVRKYEVKYSIAKGVMDKLKQKEKD